MKQILLVLIISILFACEGQKKLEPEPHLELGQKVIFEGGSPDKTYIIIGYRQSLESKVEKDWNDQAYIVFLYVNDHNDVKQATIHRNAVLKQ